MAKKIESKFLKIKCPKCKKPQIIFGKSSTKVKCNNCNVLLLKTKGGKAKIKARVEKVL